MRYFLIFLFALLSFNSQAGTALNIYKNECLLEVRRNSDSVLISSLNLDVLTWQATANAQGFQMNDDAHSFSANLNHIINFDDRDSLFALLMTWKLSCASDVSLNGDTLIVGSDTLIFTGGTNQNLIQLTDSTFYISGTNDTILINKQFLGSATLSPISRRIIISDGNFIDVNIEDLDADSTNEIQTISISNDTIYLSDGGFVVVSGGSGGGLMDSIYNANTSTWLSNLDSIDLVPSYSLESISDTIFLVKNGVRLDTVAFASPVEIMVAASDLVTDITTGTTKAYYRMPYSMNLTDVSASVLTAPTGTLLTINVKENGSTVLSTKLTIDISETTSTTAATPPVISDNTLAFDSIITFDVDGVGTGCTGLIIKISGFRL